MLLGVASCFQSLDGFTGGSSGGPDGGDGGTSSSTSSSGSPADGGTNQEQDGGSDGGPSCLGHFGAPMKRVLDADFCIDTTEVTYSQYAEFFKAKPQPDPVCSFKTNYSPPQFFTGDAAVGNVDWCDAYQFCKWAGKRLCGGLNGVQLDLVSSLTPLSEWQYACTHGGSADWPYPYGKSANPSICLYNDSPNSSTSRDVASNPACVGPDGIFDLSGNVWEWEDACDRTDGVSAKKQCNLRGGGFLRVSADWGACGKVPSGWTRDSHVEDTGIRCCSDFK